MKTIMNRKGVNEKPGENKRKVFENVTNVTFKKQKSRFDETTGVEICLRELASEKTCTRKTICTNHAPFCKKKISKMSIELKQGQLLSKGSKSFRDIDEQEKWNSFAVPVYAKAIFENLKKREECLAPQLDDLVYVCAGEYHRQSFIEMERRVLHELEFNINIPIAYSFIRRYSQCAKADVRTLTLARYICEMTLQEFDFITERASHLAASSLLLAMKMSDFGEWTPTLVYYTGYIEVELLPLVKKLNTLLAERPRKTLRSVFNKYSHSTFLKVAQIPPLDPSSFPED